MTTAAQRQMTADEFLEWSLHQEERYELVAGRPVLMTGATSRHDRIVVNLIVALHARLRGGPCRPSTADIATRTVRGNVRRPDVTVDCGRPDPADMESAQPVALFEVLSPSTRRNDLIRKTNEYQTLPSVRHLVSLEPDRLDVLVWTRSEDGGWPDPIGLDALDQSIDLPAIGISLPLSEVYEDVALDDPS